MIDRQEIDAIIAQYKKHGWEPRRVLLSAGLKESLKSAEQIFPGSEMRSSELDAIWFTRSTRPDTTAWEIRRLSGPPFAFVVVLRDDAGPEESEAALAQAETRMLESQLKPPPGH